MLRSLIADIRKSLGSITLALIVLMIFTGLLEGLSLASVVPLLMAMGIGGEGAAVQGWLGSMIIGGLKTLGIERNLYALSLFVVGVFFLTGVVCLLQAHVALRLQTGYVLSWHKRLFQGVFKARWSFFVDRRAGEIANAVGLETSRLGGAFYQTVLLVTGIVHSIIYFSIAAMLSASAAAGVLAGGLCMFIVTRPIIKRAYAIGTGISTENANLQQSLIEFIGGAKLLKATATESVAINALSEIARRFRFLSYQNGFDVQIVKAIFDFGSAALIAGIMAIGCGALKIDPAVILVVLAIFIRLLPKLSGMQQGIQSLTVSLPALETLQNLLIAAKEQEETTHAIGSHDELRTKPFSVELRGLSVAFADRYVLRDVDLSIPAGSVIALVGGSGAGKTTLVDTLLGLATPCNGEIRINGLPMVKIPLNKLRRNVGYIAQDTVLYNASVRKNLLWGHREYADQRIQEVSERMAARSFIEAMPQGLDTLVGERGTRLSGGERQRLGMVRALLGDPGLLILDEATSALDAEIESVVANAIDDLRGKVTVVIIAHRLSSVRIADRIHFMDEGGIVEAGSWTELARPGTRFWDLWSLQKGVELRS